jgi:hypothetical protein
VLDLCYSQNGRTLSAPRSPLHFRGRLQLSRSFRHQVRPREKSCRADNLPPPKRKVTTRNARRKSIASGEFSQVRRGCGGQGQDRTVDLPLFRSNRAERCADLRKRTSLTSETALGGRCKCHASRTQYSPSIRQAATPTQDHCDRRWRDCGPHPAGTRRWPHEICSHLSGYPPHSRQPATLWGASRTGPPDYLR